MLSYESGSFAASAPRLAAAKVQSRRVACLTGTSARNPVSGGALSGPAPNAQPIRLRTTDVARHGICPVLLDCLNHPFCEGYLWHFGTPFAMIAWVGEEG